MSKELITYFFNEWHDGAVNHSFHFVGFTVLGYGLATQDLLIALASSLVMEGGHIYNYIRNLHKHRENAIRIIPLQFLTFFLFAGIGWYVVSLMLR